MTWNDWYEVIIAASGGRSEEGTWQRVAKNGADKMRTLGRNLAVAGALTKAWRLGDLAGWNQAYDEYGYPQEDEPKYDAWSPNLTGKRAPGWLP